MRAQDRTLMTSDSTVLVETVPAVRDRRSQVARHYRDVWNLTEALAAPLSVEDQTVQSMPDASPTKWHRAHATWFFETFVLVPHARGYRIFDEAFGFLFNSYYESVGPRHPRPSVGVLSRPRITARIGSRTIVFIQGEVIHTESSHKYRPEVFEAIVELGGGWRVKTAWTSDAASFGVFLLDTEGLEGVVERHITNEHRV